MTKRDTPRDNKSAANSNYTQTLQQQDNHFLHPWENMYERGTNKRTIVTKSEGIYVYDSEGNKLIDGPAGMWCVNVGYGRRDIADAMAKQAIELPYSSPFSVGSEPSGILAEKLARLAPGDLNHVFFTTGGSTAVDAALRFLGFYNNFLGRPEKKHIISRQDAYHGSTYLAASVSGKSRDKEHMDLEQDFIHLLASPDPSGRPDHMSLEQFCDAAIRELEDKILEIGPDRVAGFIAEPILASGGVVIPPPGYHKASLEVCRRHDVLYISDEVVTAFGRLGHMFASEAVFDIVPDMITCAKGLTSGYVPLGALLISERLLEQLRGDEDDQGSFATGFTYSGHPVSCAAALENIDIIERENLLAYARDIAPYFMERLGTLEDLPLVAEVRGVGLMASVVCAIPGKESLELDYEIGNRIDVHCQRLGLLVRPIYHMCVMSPPIIITRAQIDDMVEILRQGITLAMEDLRKEGFW
ncbi:MAG: aminotransferase [bacterium]|nr:aminotransferase [Gammaproteobacteria bacterium]